MRKMAEEEKKKKKRTPEEQKAFYYEMSRGALQKLSKFDKEKREELSFVLTLLDSIYSQNNPNLFQFYLKKLLEDD
jgi:hypothetical protein